MADSPKRFIDPVKADEEEIANSALRYRTLFDLVPVAVYMTDAAGVIQEYNYRAVEMWGRTPSPNEKFCGSFKMHYPDGTVMPHDQCPMARVLRGEELDPSELEIIVEQENGEKLNVAVAPRTLKDDEGNILGAIHVLDDTVALHLYRIAQEAVTNAVKHSGAKNVLITLDRDKTHTCVSVQDDGKGFVVKRRGKGLGLHMMRYRANALGGELKIERRRTGGMDITCVIPSKS